MKRQIEFGFIFAGVGLFLAVIRPTSSQYQGYEVFIQSLSNCPGKQGLLDVSNLSIEKYNSSAVNISGSLAVTANVPDDTLIKISVFMESGGRYTNQIWSKQVPLCEAIQNMDGYGAALQSEAKIPNHCPLIKGVYKASGAVINVKKMPHMLPLGCWKIRSSLLDGRKQEVSCIEGISHVISRKQTKVPLCPGVTTPPSKSAI